MLTVLELLEAERTDEALALLERLREEVPLKLYDEIPYDKLKLMPLDVAGAASRFEKCWWGLVESTPAASTLRERLNKLTSWLLDLHAIRGNRFGLCGGTAAVELNLARSTINHLRKLLADYDADRTAARQALSGAGIPEWEPSPLEADVDELGRSLRAAGKMLSLTERIVRLVVERDTARGKRRVSTAYQLHELGYSDPLLALLRDAKIPDWPAAEIRPAYPSWDESRHVQGQPMQPDITREFTRLRTGREFDFICSISCCQLGVVAATWWRILGKTEQPLLYAHDEFFTVGQTSMGGPELLLVDRFREGGYTPDRTLIICEASGNFTNSRHTPTLSSFELFRRHGYCVVPPAGIGGRSANPPTARRLKLHNELLGEGQMLLSPSCSQSAIDHSRAGAGGGSPEIGILSDTAGFVAWWAVGAGRPAAPEPGVGNEEVIS